MTQDADTVCTLCGDRFAMNGPLHICPQAPRPAELVRVRAIMRKTRQVPVEGGLDTEDTYWLACEDGWCVEFVEGETPLYLRLIDGFGTEG